MKKSVVSYQSRLMMNLDEINIGWNIWTSSLGIEDKNDDTRINFLINQHEFEVQLISS